MTVSCVSAREETNMVPGQHTMGASVLGGLAAEGLFEEVMIELKFECCRDHHGCWSVAEQKV